MTTGGRRRSKTSWGWIAFGVGLALCVGAGGAIGVMLSKDDGGEAWDAERVAALALDTRGLSEDALGLSRAIEEAVAREDLEGEAEALRTELNGIAIRARRIRARAESADVASADGTQTVVSRGLREVDTTVTAFQQEVVSPLETVVREAESPSEEIADSSVDEALAGVTEALEEQDEALTTLATSLDGMDDERGDSVAAEGSEAKADDSLLSGAFQAVPLESEDVLDVGYKLEGLEAEQSSETGAGEVEISGSASGGEVSLSNGETGRVTLDLPTFHLILYWEHSDLPGGAREAGLRMAPPSEDGMEEDGDGPEADPCRYEIEGLLHCALAWFDVDVAPDYRENDLGEAVLDPGEEIRIGAPEAAGAVIVASADAGAAAELISSVPPDYVQVLVADPADVLQAACAIPSEHEEEGEAEAGETPETIGTAASSVLGSGLTVGLLTGDGESVFEANETVDSGRLDSEGEPKPPECYGLAPGSP